MKTIGKWVYDWWVDSSKQEVTIALLTVIVLQIIF